MEYNLIVKPKAQTDIRKAINWYKDENENLPVILLDKIEESLNKIRENPNHYQKRYHEIRIIFTKKFPYGIYYTLEEDNIYVHAFLHAKRNPSVAEKRIK